MMPQTRRAVDALKEAGLTRDQFRIRTPWNQDKGYGKTTIVLLCSYAQTAPYLQKLAKSFRVIVTIFDGIPCSVAIEIAREPGLYTRENGQVAQVNEIVSKNSYEQLTFEEVLEASTLF
jgi:hypothetical protein